MHNIMLGGRIMFMKGKSKNMNTGCDPFMEKVTSKTACNLECDPHK